MDPCIVPYILIKASYIRNTLLILKYGLCKIYTEYFTLLQYINQRLQIHLELLMMSGVPLETC
jgi:hypothetical protein